MRKIARLIALMMAAMATVLQVVLESGKWVLRSVRSAFAPPVGAHADVEAALDDIADTAQPTGLPRPGKADVAPEHRPGQLAVDYAMSRVGTHPAPRIRHLDVTTQAWLAGLSDSDCHRLIMHGPTRVEGHMSGLMPINAFPICKAPPPSNAFSIVDGQVHYRGRVVRAEPEPTPDEHQTLIDEVFAELVQEAEEKARAYAPA
ncbi:hypothetical protein MKK68_21100 [Methylobacterium sp. E-016]|uniref:hypothetical protein n=1 Tax=Methylobacterium sp. E-016 TaxID=2836556 RepID=UPI001FBB6F6D|nr:hypothetical protein [Methylobacterium sp. E-016]MCJ2078111.1 hypothetical protein [Methylobacterium sp. E-016]